MLRNKALTTRSKFLDMSKTFDRFWHEVLIYKLKATEVSHNLLTLFQIFLDNCYQRVLFNGQSPYWGTD